MMKRVLCLVVLCLVMLSGCSSAHYKGEYSCNTGDTLSVEFDKAAGYTLTADGQIYVSKGNDRVLKISYLEADMWEAYNDAVDTAAMYEELLSGLSYDPKDGFECVQYIQSDEDGVVFHAALSLPNTVLLVESIGSAEAGQDAFAAAKFSSR